MNWLSKSRTDLTELLLCKDSNAPSLNKLLSLKYFYESCNKNWFKAWRTSWNCCFARTLAPMHPLWINSFPTKSVNIQKILCSQKYFTRFEEIKLAMFEKYSTRRSNPDLDCWYISIWMQNFAKWRQWSNWQNFASIVANLRGSQWRQFENFWNQDQDHQTFRFSVFFTITEEQMSKMEF